MSEEKIPEEAQHPKTLVEKLAAACDAVGGVEKRGVNEQQRYKYMKAADVAKAIRHELFSRGIVVIPDEQPPEFATIELAPDRDGKPRTMTEVRMATVFRIMDSSGELCVTGYGVARDSGDKAIYKAKTGALKYFLRGLGLIPDEKDDPEFDGDQKKAKVADVGEAFEEQEEGQKFIRFQGTIVKEDVTAQSFCYTLRTVNNEGEVEVKVISPKATDTGRMADKRGWMADIEVIPALKEGNPIPGVFVLARVLNLRKLPFGQNHSAPDTPASLQDSPAAPKEPEGNQPPPKPETSKPQAPKADKPHSKLTARQIEVQNERKRVAIPNDAYYAILGDLGFEHGNELPDVACKQAIYSIKLWAEGHPKGVGA